MAIGTALLAPMAHAQEVYPTRPVTLIVGFPPGGPTDIAGRIIAEGLSKELGKPVVIENQGGAGGMVGAAFVANSTPDGYTLSVSVQSAQTRAAALNASVPYDEIESFTFIRKVAQQRNILVVNPSVEANNVEEFVAYLKAHPGELNTSGSFGASSHIGSTLFDAAYGTEMTFINYPGGAQPITDLLAGVVQAGVFTEATIAQHVKSGKLKALAIAGKERSPAFPDIPTIAEAGGQEVDISPWFGVVGPAGLPDDVTKTIGEALDRMVQREDYITQLETIGATPITDTDAAGFEASAEEEIVYWGQWAKDVGVPLTR